MFIHLAYLDKLTLMYPATGCDFHHTYHVPLNLFGYLKNSPLAIIIRMRNENLLFFIIGGI